MNALTEVGAPTAREPRLGRALRAILQTGPDWVPTVQRVTLGGVVLAHGMQKALGWFGGGGVTGTVDFFQNVLHLPAAVALLVTFSDFFGSIALIAGFMTRIAALGTGLVMIGAVITLHAGNGFFMNWFGNQAGEGFEFHLLALALVVALIRSGAGRASIDARIAGALRS
jgi:putative oxidoreductase